MILKWAWCRVERHLCTIDNEHDVELSTIYMLLTMRMGVPCINNTSSELHLDLRRTCWRQGASKQGERSRGDFLSLCLFQRVMTSDGESVAWEDKLKKHPKVVFWLWQSWLKQGMIQPGLMDTVQDWASGALGLPLPYLWPWTSHFGSVSLPTLCVSCVFSLEALWGKDCVYMMPGTMVTWILVVTLPPCYDTNIINKYEKYRWWCDV